MPINDAHLEGIFISLAIFIVGVFYLKFIFVSILVHLVPLQHERRNKHTANYYTTPISA